MLIKVVVAAAGIAFIAYLTMSIWASCDLRRQTCTTVCEVRHMDSDLKKAGCKASCTSDNIACVSKEYLEKKRAK